MDTADLKKNYYELFNLPVGFTIDSDVLSARFITLQNLTHPDKYAAAGDLQRRIAVQQSAHINQAYHTLRQPLLRAKYLLSLQGIDIDKTQVAGMDGSFLMQQIKWREQLEQIRDSKDAAADLVDFENKINSAVKDVEDVLERSFSKLTSDIHTAKDYVRRLQFLMKLREEIDEMAERID